MKYFKKYLRKPNSSELQDVKQYAILMLAPIVSCIITFVVFWTMFSKGIHLNLLEGLLTKFFTFTILGLIYAGRANKAMDKADTGYDEIMEAVREVSQEKFNKVYHKRISRWNHLFLGTISSFMIGLIMLVDYDSLFTGSIIIISTTYVMTLAMIFAVNLDHAGESSLYGKQIPEIFIKNYEKYQKEMEEKLKNLEGKGLTNKNT